MVRFVRPAPEVHLDLTRLAVTHDLQLDRRAGRVGADRSRELDRVANGLAVDLDDRVPRLDACLRSRAADHCGGGAKEGMTPSVRSPGLVVEAGELVSAGASTARSGERLQPQIPRASARAGAIGAMPKGKTE